MVNKLKPCPFCGSGNCIYAEQEGEAWFLYCCNCHASGPYVPSKEEAIEAWNRRAGDTHNA